MTKIFAPDKPSPDEYLEHFGIKGMKWGIRKDRESTSAGSTDREVARLTKKRNRLLGSRRFLQGQGMAITARERYGDNPDTYKKAKRLIKGRGALDTAMMAVGGVAIARYLGKSSNQKKAILGATVVMSGKVAATHISELRSIKNAEKFENTTQRLIDLEER